MQIMAKTSFAFPKPQYWQQFEDLTHEVFKYAFGDNTPTKHGRSGQKQFGVDVFGRQNGNGPLIGIQCKRREEKDAAGGFPFGNPLSQEDVKEEIGKVDLTKLKLVQFIVATTAPADGVIQRWVEQYNEERWQQDRSAFRVSVWHWQDYEAYLNSNTGLQQWYFKEIIDHFGRERSELQILTVLRDAFSHPAFRDQLTCETVRDFRQAIKHTQQAVDLGLLVDRVTGLTIRKAVGGVKSLSLNLAKKNGPLLTKTLTKLLDRFDWGLKTPFIDEPGRKGNHLSMSGEILEVNDHELGEELNGYRRKAIQLVNELLTEAHLDTVDVADF
jgi:hypothetical protein